MDLIDELIAVVRVLEKSQVPYAICGGLAVAIHGRPRLTVDIDLVVPRSNMQQAVHAAKSVGFDMETGWVDFPESGLGTGRLFRLTKVEGAEFLTLDLLEVDSTENPIWANRIRSPVRDQTASVLSKKALIQMKSASTRTKDRLDIEMLRDEAD